MRRMTSVCSSRRASSIAESATLAIDARAKSLQAAGKNVISFGAGEPDFPTPAHIVEAARAACSVPAWHHYTPTGGLPELREAIVDKTERDSGFAVEQAQVVVCNGGKHALYNAFMTLIDPGDEVLLPAPYWVSYPEMARLAGGTVIELPTTEATGFRVTIEQLEGAATERTKVLVFASPSNPTGVVYPPQEVEALGRWAVSRGIWIIADEIYEHLVYGDNRFTSIPVLVPEIADRCIVINGVAKTYAMTGWRVGWMIAPPDIASAATSLQSHATSNVSNVGQAAAVVALWGDLEGVAEMREAFDRRRTTMHKMLNDIDGVTSYEPQGAFYCWPSLQGLMQREVGGTKVSSSLELAEVLLERAGVAIVPGEGFGAPGYARLSYALGDDDLVKGVSRMADFIMS